MSIDYLLLKHGWGLGHGGYHRINFLDQIVLCTHDGPPWPRIRVVDNFILCTQCLRLPPLQEKLLLEVARISTGRVREFLSLDPDFATYVSTVTKPTKSDYLLKTQTNIQPKTKEEIYRSNRVKIAKKVNQQKSQCLSFSFRYKPQLVQTAQRSLLKESGLPAWVQIAAGRLFQDSQLIRYRLSAERLGELQIALGDHNFKESDTFQEIIALYEVHEWPDSVFALLMEFSNKSNIANFEKELSQIFNLRNRLIDSLHDARASDEETKSRGFRQFEWMTPPEDWRTD